MLMDIMATAPQQLSVIRDQNRVDIRIKTAIMDQRVLEKESIDGVPGCLLFLGVLAQCPERNVKASDLV